MRRLVLVHGLGVSPRYFMPLREELARDYDVAAPDLRGGAALVLAGLVAEGTTVVDGATHILRGYEKFEKRLCELGATVAVETGTPVVP